MSDLTTENIQSQEIPQAPAPADTAQDPGADSGNDKYLRARKIVEQMPPDQRTSFMNRFRSLDDNGKNTVVDRLLSDGGQAQPKVALDNKTPITPAAGTDLNTGMFPGQKIEADGKGGSVLMQRGFKDLPGAIVDSFTNYALGLARGADAGAEGIYRTLDGIDKIQQHVTGLGTDFFAKSANNMAKAYAALPKTSEPILGSIFELAGRLPADAAQFVATRGAISGAGTAAGFGKIAQAAGQAAGVATGRLETMGQVAKAALSEKGLSVGTDAAAIGVTNALTEYSQSQDLQKSGEAFKNGVMFGVAVPAAGAFVQSAFKTMATLGKNAAKSYIQFVTGSQEIANDFVNNPQKFNTNPLRPTPNLDEFKLASDQESASLKAKHDAQRLQFNQNEVDNKAKIQEQLNLAKERMQDSVRSSEQRITDVSKEALPNLVEKNRLALDQFDQSLQDKYFSVFDSFGQKVKMLRQQTGEAVGRALDNAIQLDPLISLPSKSIQGRLYSVINELSPFKKAGSKFIPVVNVADKSDVNTFNAYMQQFNSMANEGKLSIQFLQESKTALGNMSSKYFAKGDSRLGKLYQEMSKELNPVRLMDKTQANWMWNKSNTAIPKALQDIADANKGYYETMGKYERSMKYYFNENAQGDLIPKQDAVIGAIKSNDVGILRQMKIADSALPKEDQVLPQLGKMLDERDSVMASQKAIVKNLKRRLSDEKVVIKQANRESIRELALNQSKFTADQTKQAQQRLFDFNQRVQNEQAALSEKLNNQQITLLRQDALRSIMAKTPAARLLQYGGIGAGAYTGFAGRTNPAALALAGSASPIVAANLVKAGIKGSRAMDALVGQRFNRIAQAVDENFGGGLGDFVNKAAAGKTTLAKAVQPAAELAAPAVLLSAGSTNANAQEIPENRAVKTILGEAENQGAGGMNTLASAIRNRNSLRGAYGEKAIVEKDGGFYRKSSNGKFRKIDSAVVEQAKKAWVNSKNKDYASGSTHWFSDNDLKQKNVQNIIKSEGLKEVKNTGGNHFFVRSKK